MSRNCIQLEMNFNGTEGNLFRSRLETGEFQILAEIPLPESEISTDEISGRYADYEYLVLGRKTPTSLAITTENLTSIDPVLFASRICKTDWDRHLLYLSGRDHSSKQLFEMARLATGEGFKNFCCVSGKALPGEDARKSSERPFTESLCTLANLREEFGNTILTGAAVNPYKYTAEALCTQYFKLIRKLNAGASFAVTQFGWDILKLQELRWELYQRSYHIPTIARLLFLSQDKARELCEGTVPGVQISPDLAHILRRELQYTRPQFEAAQIRQLQLYAAGVRLLGYSGIQLAGADSPEKLEMLLDKIDEALLEFKDFNAWCSAFRQYYERLDMAPYPHRFYLFENLLSSALPPDTLPFAEADFDSCSGKELFLYRLGKVLCGHAEELPASEKRLTKKLLFGCKNCNRCRLPQTFYICPETCPIHRANGPCGEIRVDGTCPFDHQQECIFMRQLRLVNKLRCYPALEEGVVPDGAL
ncbi:MAG: methylenetetrahydrofolate reductase C-terminal domain-containing protein [Lentisphaeria bacterium]|nr:methylenetetrahydrofolate reductase C-terminal domain-containing protein [Lentisphaeria bacterium]